MFTLFWKGIVSKISNAHHMYQNDEKICSMSAFSSFLTTLELVGVFAKTVAGQSSNIKLLSRKTEENKLGD